MLDGHSPNFIPEKGVMGVESGWGGASGTFCCVVTTSWGLYLCVQVGRSSVGRYAWNRRESSLSPYASVPVPRTFWEQEGINHNLSSEARMFHHSQDARKRRRHGIVTGAQDEKSQVFSLHGVLLYSTTKLIAQTSNHPATTSTTTSTRTPTVTTRRRVN